MIYDYPQYYEVAFSFRDIRAEASFLKACINRFGRTKSRNILEIGCGPAPHAGELASFGYHFIGLDINRNMLDYATYKWRELEPRPDFVEADMVSFELTEKVDFAYVMLGSLYTRSKQDLVNHLDSMSRALQPGGLYFLDWCVQFGDPRRHAEHNSFRFSRDDIEVESRFNISLIDRTDQTYEEVWTLDVNDHGRQRELTMTERNRALLPEEFLSLINDRHDLELAGWWRSWDFDSPIRDGESIERPVALLRKLD